jgi:hypothetical protein
MLWARAYYLKVHVNMLTVGQNLSLLACGNIAKRYERRGTPLFTGNLIRHPVSKKMNVLQRKAKELFKTYDQDKYCIPSTRAYLFNQSLLNRQSQPRDALECWIASVEEAINTRKDREALHAELCSKTFLRYFLPTPTPIHTEEWNSRSK